MEMFHLKLQSLQTLKTLPSNQDIQSNPIPIKLNKLFDNYTQQQILLEKQQKNQQQFFYDTTYLTIFKLIVLVTIDWYIFVLALSIAFHKQIESSANITMHVIIIAIFIADIIVSSCFQNNAYKTKNIITFIKSNVEQIIDIVTTIPIILYVAYPTETTLYLQSLFIFKLYKRRQYKKRIFYKLSSHRILRGIFITLHLLIDVLVVTHYLAIFYVLMDEKLKNRYDSDYFYWMSNNDAYEFDITDSVWYIKYLYAQFFSLGTWTLIAPGPTPKNPVEVAYTNFAMVFFIIVASKIVKQIIQMIDEDGDQDTPEPVISEQKIQQFMNGKKIGNETKNKILIYTRFLCQTKQNHSNALSQIKRLPISLQAEISSQFWNTSKLIWLKQLDNDYLLKKMLDIMDEKLVQFGEYIVNQGQMFELFLLKCSLKSFIFLSQFGFSKQHSIELKVNQQDFLFQQQFLTDQPIPVSVMALKTSAIIIINKTDFMQIIKSDQLLYQSFCRIKDLTLNNKRSLNKCYYCNLQHQSKVCTQMFYGQLVRHQYWISQNQRIPILRKKVSTKTKWRNKKVNKLSPLFKRTDSITQYDNIHIDAPFSMNNYFNKYNIY